MKTPIVRPFAYPDSDGKPLAENTLQLEWIVKLLTGLEGQYANRPDVFVAGDNLIYPKMGRYHLKQAPDVYVAFGVVKGHRGSYKVWEENNVFPQVVIEVLSPGNRPGKMRQKLRFYDRFGAEEYYVLNPDRTTLEVYFRRDGRLQPIPQDDVNGFVSPRLGITFVIADEGFEVYGSDGLPFWKAVDLSQRAKRTELAEREKDEAVREKNEAVREKNVEARGRAAAERRAAILTEKLRSLGIDPDAIERSSGSDE